ncbi:hypothetical protein H072_696 [Dactylellina haptotyla CBS 200.50]|uniref:G domain-containing protein n=1 Tax=Dactylellina haptotyla (strain CBS 200.50) TaxID=1284197 RepID=S8AQS0_DACHA|nr:hypothetical protein H072_696 [Dactylellina haptotyla CBS 200.50]
MGVTGAGKSSFIQLVTGNKAVKIGHSLVAETSEITSYDVQIGWDVFTLVDTPGFNDTSKSDVEILRLIVDWLSTTYRSGAKLCGILYLHRITDARMTGSAIRSLKAFKELCGDEFFQYITLGTSCWSLVDESVGAAREEELTQKSAFWKYLLDRGAQVVRIPEDAAAAKRLVHKMGKMGNPAALHVQRETVDTGKRFSELAVSRHLNVELERLRKEHEEEKARLRFEQEKARLEAEAKQQQELERIREEERERQKIEIANIERRNTADNYMAKIKLAMAKYDAAVSDGNAIARFAGYSTALGTACDNCFKTIGHTTYYKCAKCNDELDGFLLCETCHNAPGVYCNYKSHFSDMTKERVSDGPPGCRHTISPWKPNASAACDRCKGQLGPLFFHCCKCRDDNFDICVNCISTAETCKKSWSITGHPLHAIIYYQDGSH